MQQELARITGIELSDWTKYIKSASADAIKQQVVFEFENGYGASVVRGPYSYGGDRGLFELGVLKIEGKKHHLVYDTPITDDVCGYLTGDDVIKILAEIKSL